MGLRLGNPQCPVCGAFLKPTRFEWTQLWATRTPAFRCQSCATMLQWTARRWAMPACAIWLIFFAPPAFVRGYWNMAGESRLGDSYMAISWTIGSLALIAFFLCFPWDAQKCSDE